jgi:hypothetical protein
MGYFSNGTEGEIFEARHCRRCVHFGDDGFGNDDGDCCPIMFAHVCYQGETGAVEDILGMLIKRNGITNECAMFVERKEAGDGTR